MRSEPVTGLVGAGTTVHSAFPHRFPSPQEDDTVSNPGDRWRPSWLVALAVIVVVVGVLLAR